MTTTSFIAHKAVVTRWTTGYYCIPFATSSFTLVD